MSAAPYMPLDVSDYLADTAHLDARSHGAYLLLIMNYWQRQKPLQNDARKLMRIARVNPSEWDDVWSDIGDLFIDDGDQLRHKRVDVELESVNMKYESARANGLKGAKKRWENQRANSPPIATPSQPQCQNDGDLLPIRKGKEREDTLSSLRSDNDGETPRAAKSKPVDWDKALFDRAVALLEGKPRPDNPDKTVTKAEARSLAGKLKKSRGGRAHEAFTAITAAATAADPVQFVLGAIAHPPERRAPPSKKIDFSQFNEIPKRRRYGQNADG